MSFDFLPSPIYIILALFGSGILFNYTFKSYTPETKFIIIGTFLAAISGFGFAISKIIEVYLIAYKQYIGIIQVVSSIIAIIGFIIAIIGGWKDVMNDPRRRKLLLTSIILISISIIMLIIIVIIFVFIIPKEEDVSYLLCKLINSY